MGGKKREPSQTQLAKEEPEEVLGDEHLALSLSLKQGPVGSQTAWCYAITQWQLVDRFVGAASGCRLA